MRKCDAGLLIEIADSYLDSKTTGSELVNRIDDLVADDALGELPENIADLVYDFQNELSLFVRDTETKKESSVYFCEDELPNKVREFKKELLGLN